MASSISSEIELFIGYKKVLILEDFLHNIITNIQHEMKKINSSLLIAIAAISLTIVSKANKIYSRQITGCYQALQLKTGAGIPFSPTTATDCYDAIAILNNANSFGNGLWLNANINHPPMFDCIFDVKYCCAIFDDAYPPPPVMSGIIPRVIAYESPMAKYYRVVDISCDFE